MKLDALRPISRTRKMRVYQKMELLSALTIFSTASFALPVIPGASGFGMDTPAGRGGTVMRVTNLADSGAGSLRACAEGNGPRVCIFDVSGTITMSEELNIRNPYVTIAGQTAPSPGIVLRGAALRIAASHVLVQHLRVRVGDAAEGPLPANRDALQIESSNGPITNVVVDHCSFSWSIDEVASIWQSASNITLRSNFFSEPLNDSIHVENGIQEPHGFGVILGPADNGVSNITMVGNLMAHQVSRNPLAYSNFVMVNNVVYDYGDAAVEVANRNVPISAAVVGNVFKRGPSSVGNMPPVFLPGGSSSDAILSGTRVYMKDNLSQGTLYADASSTAAAFVQTTVDRASLLVNSAPLWPSGMVATSPSTVLDSVLNASGARPADRDAVDARVVNEVRNGTGQIINCVSDDGSQRCSKNGGGWPSIAQRTRALTLPANYQQVGSDGYTVLESWLQQMALEVEGKGERPTPPSNAKLF